MKFSPVPVFHPIPELSDLISHEIQFFSGVGVQFESSVKVIDS